jgi:hydrogenase expression/formation protein HypC
MCLAVPGEVIEVGEEAGLRMGTVDFGGARRSICLDLAPEATVGTFVLVHAGFAISVLDRAAANETIRLLGEALPSEGDVPMGDDS